VPLRLALLVAAYSAGVKALMAFSGRYRSPVLDDFLPDLVRHFCLVQSFRLCCDFLSAINGPVHPHDDGLHVPQTLPKARQGHQTSALRP